LFLKPRAIDEVLCDNHLINDLERPISLDDCLVIGKLHPQISRMCHEVSLEFGEIWFSGPFPKFDHPNGTWRQMMITQPSSKTIKVRIYMQGMSEEFECQRGTGLTLGGAYDLIHSKFPTKKSNSNGEVSIRGYVVEDDMPLGYLSATRCKVQDGEIQRPKDLPLPVPSSDSYSFTDSDDSDDDPCVYTERMRMLDEMRGEIVWTEGIGYHEAGGLYEDDFDYY